MRFPGFCGPSGQLRSILADQERSVNLYPERPGLPGGSTDLALYLVPGVEPITLRLPAIADITPTVTNQGTPGATAYDYSVIGLLGDGVTHTALVSAGTVTGAAVLNGTDFNRVTWSAATNAVYYDVYQQVVATGVITRIATAIQVLTFDDIGAGGTLATPPITNTTGVVYVPTGAGRGHAFVDSREFTVQTSVLYEISGALIIPRGVVAVDGNPATISTNGDGGDQLFITSGGNGYNYELTTNILTAVAGLAGKATMGDMKDGFSLAFDGNASTWYYSALLNSSSWDPTDFVQRSGQGDPWVSLKVKGPYIFLLGQYTSEIWYNAGTSPNPFARSANGVVSVGCAAAFSPEVAGDALVWLGRTVNGQGKVYRAEGFAPDDISEYNINVAMEGYPNISDAIGDTDHVLGHTTYYLTLPSANVTWCWDEKERIWYERGTWIAELSRYDAMRPLYHAFAFGEHRWLDRENGRVYVMSPDIYTDVPDDAGAARPLRWLRRAPGLSIENRIIYYPALEVDVQTGVGLSSGQGSDPQLMMRMSDDGGHTWGNELSISVGALGEYGTRVQFLRCGGARRRVFEISGSDPVFWAILGAYLPDFEKANPGLGQQQRVA